MQTGQGVGLFNTHAGFSITHGKDLSPKHRQGSAERNGRPSVAEQSTGQPDHKKYQ